MWKFPNRVASDAQLIDAYTEAKNLALEIAWTWERPPSDWDELPTPLMRPGHSGWMGPLGTWRYFAVADHQPIGWRIHVMTDYDLFDSDLKYTLMYGTLDPVSDPVLR